VELSFALRLSTTAFLSSLHCLPLPSVIRQPGNQSLSRSRETNKQKYDTACQREYRVDTIDDLAMARAVLKVLCCFDCRPEGIRGSGIFEEPVAG
jgi:hypothetical protein